MARLMTAKQVVRKAEIVQVIRIVHLVGAGEDLDDPVREMTEYWTMDGECLVRQDPCFVDAPLS